MGSKSEIKIAGLYTALFLLGGVIHVVVDPWDFTSCVTQIYYSSLVLAWAVTIRYRIVNRPIRQLIVTTAVLFLLGMFFQMSRYRIFEYFPTVSRFCWYGYYIPILFAPVLFFFATLYLHLAEGEKPNRLWLLMLLPSVVFLALIMTNDLHQLLFAFSDATTGKNSTYTHGILFYVMYGWYTVVLVLAVSASIRQCRIPGIGKGLWLPLYFSAFSFISILSLFDLPKIAGTTVWLSIECLAMTILGMEEACIQLGLIPANSSYRMIASHANKPFMISDESGSPVYGAADAKEMFQRKESVQIHTKPIRGGTVSWAVDLTDLMALNRELEKATEGIESRNAYLQSENALKEEQSRLAARNALYNEIAGIVKPQLDTIEHRLEGDVDDSCLAKIVFLNAYIKRRSNMELLRSDLRSFPAEELAMAIRESCEYLKLCGVNAMLHITPQCELSADMQLFLYEAFEIVVEACLDTLRLLLVNITMHQDRPVLRMTLKASQIDTGRICTQIASLGGTVRAFAEDDEVTLTVKWQEGGARL